MKAFKTIGLLGLAITTALNLVALLWFRRASAQYLSDNWWAGWFPSYVLWLSFTLIGFASHSRPNLGPGRPSGLWLMLLLLLAALVPSVCLLWFMNQAVQNERLAVRQKLAEAYRVSLSLVQNQVEANWRQTASALDAEADRLSPSALFAKQVRAGVFPTLLFCAAHRVPSQRVEARRQAVHGSDDLSVGWAQIQNDRVAGVEVRQDRQYFEDFKNWDSQDD